MAMTERQIRTTDGWVPNEATDRIMGRVDAGEFLMDLDWEKEIQRFAPLPEIPHYVRSSIHGLEGGYGTAVLGRNVGRRRQGDLRGVFRRRGPLPGARSPIPSPSFRPASSTSRAVPVRARSPGTGASPGRTSSGSTSRRTCWWSPSGRRVTSTTWTCGARTPRLCRSRTPRSTWSRRACSSTSCPPTSRRGC